MMISYFRRLAGLMSFESNLCFSHFFSSGPSGILASRTVDGRSVAGAGGGGATGAVLEGLGVRGAVGVAVAALAGLAALTDAGAAGSLRATEELIGLLYEAG